MITEEKSEAIISSLAEHGNDCAENSPLSERFSPILIGDVLEKMDKMGKSVNFYLGGTTYNDQLIHLWARCGKMNLSLQSILEGAEWENKKKNGFICFDEVDGSPQPIQVLTSPASELFEFLDTFTKF